MLTAALSWRAATKLTPRLASALVTAKLPLPISPKALVTPNSARADPTASATFTAALPTRVRSAPECSRPPSSTRDLTPSISSSHDKPAGGGPKRTDPDPALFGSRGPVARRGYRCRWQRAEMGPLADQSGR